MNGLFRPEWSTLKKLMFRQSMGGETWSTITGNPVSFTARNAPLRKLEVAFSPVQTGTGDPSPDNVRPISGWSSLNVEQRGVNLWDEEWEVGGINSVGQKTTQTDRIRSKNYIPVKCGKSYFIKSYGQCCCYDADKTFISVTPYTTIPGTGYLLNIPENASYILFAMPTAYGTTYKNDISINYPSTDTAYHAYNPASRSISISLGQTVYSGYVDVVTGVGEVDKVAATLNALTKAQAFSNGNYSAAQLYLLPSLSTTVAANQTHGAISTSGKEGFAYFGVARTNEPFPYNDGAFAITTDGRVLCVYDTDKTITSEAFDTKYGTTQIVYPLATPLTIQLTPQEVESLAGDNVMWTDAQNLEVTYRSN